MGLDEDTAAYLGQWKKTQLLELKMRGIGQTSDTPVANNEKGGYLDPRGFSRWFRDFCVENGFGEYKDTSVYRDNQGKYAGWKRT